ncbi:MAG TPA: alpha-hydroxy acid oxidase [Gemmatimonadaceae bacterium]|nr:alpha-hydroxy acid oxidase [Gemmatimonadaceae bacterium]
MSTAARSEEQRLVPEPVNLMEYEARARERMDVAAYDYIAGAACDECTLAENRRAFDRLWLRPRMLVDVSRIEMGTSVLGMPISQPILLAPTALNRLAHPEGELAAARAAGAAGTIMVASTVATFTLEEISAVATGPLFFQLYICKDRGITRELVDRATDARYRALVLTVDLPYLGRRERDVRRAFTIPSGMSIRNFEVADRTLAAAHTLRDATFDEHARYLFDPAVTWDIISWLRSITSLPILVKGVLTPEDAHLAIQQGVEGIIVSNHGGRQLDGVEPTIAALPRVAEAVDDRVELLVDGGIRRGTDVLKALALGARAVLIGRAYLYGLAVGGEAGVRHVLELLRAELELAMALSGRASLASIDRALVAPKPADA